MELRLLHGFAGREEVWWYFTCFFLHLLVQFSVVTFSPDEEAGAFAGIPVEFKESSPSVHRKNVALYLFHHKVLGNEPMAKGTVSLKKLGTSYRFQEAVTVGGVAEGFSSVSLFEAERKSLLRHFSREEGYQQSQVEGRRSCSIGNCAFTSLEVFCFFHVDSVSVAVQRDLVCHVFKRRIASTFWRGNGHQVKCGPLLESGKLPTWSSLMLGLVTFSTWCPLSPLAFYFWHTW